VVEAYAGSFGRVAGQFECGRKFDEGWHAFASGNWFNENGWRDYSPSEIGQLFAKVGRRSEAYEIDVSVTGANTNLIGNGLVSQTFLAQSQTSIFTRPDQTKNQLAMVNVSGNALLEGGSQLDGLVSFCNVRTRTLNGELNDAFEGAVEGGAVDVPSAVDNRRRTQQNGAGAALQ